MVTRCFIRRNRQRKSQGCSNRRSSTSMRQTRSEASLSSSSSQSKFVHARSRFTNNIPHVYRPNSKTHPPTRPTKQAGQTPLQTHAKSRTLWMALVGGGADPNVPLDEQKNTLLHQAQSPEDIAALLQSPLIDVNVTNEVRSFLFSISGTARPSHAPPALSLHSALIPSLHRRPDLQRCLLPWLNLLVMEVSRTRYGGGGGGVRVVRN